MQRSRVDFPRPLAATSPIRSPALTTRFSREKSGALSVTPRLRMLISVMIVLWSCRRSRHPGHAAIVGCQGQSAAMDENAGANARTRNAAEPRRADQENVRKSLWSALQTHLQGVARATLAIIPEKCRHRAALLSCLSGLK